jgi:GNAT superfamily N-acetyltransferase
VLLDAEPEWGPLLDNLHVAPALKGRGIGRELLHRARAWVARAAPGRTMHLWVIDQNQPARRFYERVGGSPAERRTNEMTPGVHVSAVRYVWPPWG